LLDNGPAARFVRGTAASSAGQDVVNAKFDIGFLPTARKYEVSSSTRDPVGASDGPASQRLTSPLTVRVDLQKRWLA
jgi:hypothetical protein